MALYQSQPGTTWELVFVSYASELHGVVQLERRLFLLARLLSSAAVRMARLVLFDVGPQVACLLR